MATDTKDGTGASAAATDEHSTEGKPSTTGSAGCSAKDVAKGGEKQAKETTKSVSYFQLYRYADRQDKFFILLGIIGAGLNGAGMPIFSIVFGNLINGFGLNIFDPDVLKNDVNNIVPQFIYIGIACWIGATAQMFFWTYTSVRQTNRIRHRYLTSVLRQETGFFESESDPGKLMQGLNEDCMTIQSAIGDRMGRTLFNLFTAIIGIIVAFTRGWDMTLVMLAVTPLLVIAGWAIATLLARLTTRMNNAYGSANSQATQALGNIRTVYAFTGEERSLAAYNAALEDPVIVGIKQSGYAGFIVGFTNLVAFGTYSLALWYGSTRIEAGDYTGGEVLNVLFAALIGGFALGQAAPNLQYFQQGAASAGRVFEIMKRQPLIDLDHPGQELEEVRGELTLEKVDFCYPARPDVPVLRGFSLDIPAGKTVALVGESGSGKSTVVALAERFYDPSAGRVLLDGVDLRQLQLRWLRAQLSLVSQEPALFATTIRQNIAFGRPGADDAEIVAAARTANAHNFIAALPEGYDTHVGEKGVQMSGGQKQRIAIARAILKSPKVLLLDEATSALDARSEHIVQKALDRLMRTCTTVVVAHRLSTVVGADVIAVVSRGAIVERGSHTSLLQAGGVYATLVSMQRAAKRPNEGEDEEDEEAADEFDENAVVGAGTAVGGGGGTTRADVELGQSGAVGRQLSHVSVRTVSVDRESSGELVPAAYSGAIVGGGRGPSFDGVALPGAEPPLRVASRKRSLQGATLMRPAEPVVATVDAEKVQQGWSRMATWVRRLFGAKEVDERNGGKPGKQATEYDDEEPPPKVSMARLAALNRPELPALLLGLVGAGALGFMMPAFSIAFSSLISLFYTTDMDELKSGTRKWCLVFLGIGVGALIFSWFQSFFFGVVGHRLGRRVRVLMMTALLRQEVGWYDRDENASGVLASKLSTDALAVRGQFGDTMGLLSQNLVTFVGGYVLAFTHGWKMTLVVTSVVPIIMFAAILQNRHILNASLRENNAFANTNQTAQEAVGNIRTIAAFSMQGEVSGLYGEQLVQPTAESKKRGFSAGLGFGFSQFVLFGTYSLAFWYAGLLVSRGESTLEEVLKVFFAIFMAAFGIAQAQMFFPDVAKGRAATQRVFAVVDRKSKIDASDPSGDRLPDCKGHVQLVDVTFAYPLRPAVNVFENFSLDVEPGRTTALVGESGSGKSTVISLIERYYDPKSGQVLLDGHDVRTLNLKWLRSTVGLVSQEPILFSMTVAENIAYGRPDASMEDVVAAARAANAHGFIENLPEGYHTRLGEGGIQLSGGQKQRVAIARAVVKDARVLLLDEATSALDTESEVLVQHALEKLMAGRTTIVVAHRLSTIRAAHRIGVVYKGVLVEQGTHDELMAIPQGAYARLVQHQLTGMT